MVEEAPPFNASVLQPIQSPSLLNSFQILLTSSLAEFFPLVGFASLRLIIPF